MSTIKRVRLALALIVSVVLTITVTACSPIGYGSDANPKTSKYLFDQFVDGKYLDPFETSSPDIGSTMEAMIQLSGVGYDKEKQAEAVKWLTSNTNLLTSTGQRAEFIFAAHALGFESDASVVPVLEKLIAAVPDNAVIEDTNNFSYSWVIFGLAAAGEKELANKVAVKLSTMSEVLGGYKYILHDSAGDTTADVTGFSILSMKATEGYGSAEDEAAKTFAISKAKNWLATNIQSNTHWVGYGNVDISGTAYGAMALTALGDKTDNLVKWLQSQEDSKNGGLVAPWSEPTADLFSTTQAILAMSKLNFIDILNHSR